MTRKFSVEYFHPRVEKEIQRWPPEILAAYVHLTEILMDFGPKLGMPYSRAMGKGLFELRPRGREGIGRAFYCFVKGQRVVILHAFIKKSQTTPRRDLVISRRRIQEIKDA